jgi:hypothetical protein
LGPGAANNSTLGGSLITTIAFGVPSSVTMAILMGAFLIQGIVPGPDMLIPEPKGHLALTFSFVWINVLSNVITVAACFLVLNLLVKVTTIRGNLLIPFILLLIYLGAFAEKNTFADLILVLLFGALGWTLVRLNWPRAPLILGLVLGPLAESKLFLSTDNYGAAWLYRPGVLILAALTIFGALYPFLKARRRRRQAERLEPAEPAARGAAPREAADARGSRPFRFSWDSAFTLFIIVVFALALWRSRTFDFRTGLFPWAIGIPVFGLAVIQFIVGLSGMAPQGDGSSVAEGGDLPAAVVNQRTAGMFGWILIYFIAIWLLGFSIGVPLCTLIQLALFDKEKWPLSLIYTACSWAFIYAIFDKVLHVPFPDGQLLVWLGLS